MNRRGLLKGLFAVTAYAAMPLKYAALFVTEQVGWKTFISHFRWAPDNVVEDWRYVVRIANIETDDA
jgi:hypothetical protein